MHSACLTNWYYRLGRLRGDELIKAESYWQMILDHSAFVIHGLPNWTEFAEQTNTKYGHKIDNDLADLEPRFFLPSSLPIVLGNNRQVKRHREHTFGINVSIEPALPDAEEDFHLAYWLFPDQPKGDLGETAETTGLPVFDAEISPGKDFDLAYRGVYQAASFHLGFSDGKSEQRAFQTLARMGWRILTPKQLQEQLLFNQKLASHSRGHGRNSKKT